MFNVSVKSALGGGVFLVIALVAAGSFVIAAVQGDFGVMRRVQIQAEAAELIHNATLCALNWTVCKT